MSVMSHEEFLNLIAELVELPAGRLTGPEDLEGLGWDSLAVVGFLGLVDEHFGIAVSPEQVKTCVSVNDLAGLLGDAVGR
jgi:acyl carrier protein